MSDDYEFTTANLTPWEKAAEKAREIVQLERDRDQLEKRISELRHEFYELSESLPEEDRVEVLVTYLSFSVGRGRKQKLVRKAWFSPTLIELPAMQRRC